MYQSYQLWQENADSVAGPIMPTRHARSGSCFERYTKFIDVRHSDSVQFVPKTAEL